MRAQPFKYGYMEERSKFGITHAEALDSHCISERTRHGLEGATTGALGIDGDDLILGLAETCISLACLKVGMFCTSTIYFCTAARQFCLLLTSVADLSDWRAVLRRLTRECNEKDMAAANGCGGEGGQDGVVIGCCNVAAAAAPAR
eukprot:CAMPEP_0172662480 /NCGR_PEP_ID=MMETSP1074-20121228/5383_1 /TAXON_ID=2916 /ORGANISM="Ceratium fusus, Strain PA161109" /LENGTH=145 /DNA_ID=CAMNT_0013478399 /DNA_START=780 /DNA_END=1218 /DNA_ORIENTATION=+